MNTAHAPMLAEPIAVAAPRIQKDSRPGRLVVVIPGVNEVALLSRRILEVAQTRGQDVCLIGVPSRPVPEIELRRQLALVAGFLQGAGARVETRFETGSDWILRLGWHLDDQDLLACCVGNVLPTGRRPLTDILASHFGRSVYAFEDLDYDARPNASLLTRSAPWLGSIAVILGFLWMQMQISQHVDSLASTILLLLSIPIEIGLILLCNAALA